MYFGLKKKSYRIIKSWFHVEMLSLIIHFFVCSILKASFVVNDAAYGLGIPQKAMLLMTIDLNFLVEATVFCAVIWKVKDFENDEVGRRPPVSTGEGNVVVGLTTEPVEECHGSENDNARARSQYFILESPTAVVADDGDKLPTYDECINNQSEAIDPPRYEEISDIVWDACDTYFKQAYLGL